MDRQTEEGRPMTPDPDYLAYRTRTMDLAAAPMVVACRRRSCQAAIGYHCRSSGGYANSAVNFHAVRRQDVRGMAEDDIITAQERIRQQQKALAVAAHLTTIGAAS
jgi:hypothetical protein